MDEILSPYLQECIQLQSNFKAGPFILVIFGGAGDLSQKKIIPSLLNLFEKKIIEDFTILALGKSDRTHNDYHLLLEKSLKERFSEKFKKDIWNKFKERLFYHFIDLEDKKSFDFLCPFIQKNNKENLIYYFAMPPDTIFKTLESLNYLHLCREKKSAKIVIEKPFGHDKKSSIELNEKIKTFFDEKQIYRIDHYLGKESVQNFLFFRFSNAIFEPLWNRNFIDHVQITALEEIGISSRGLYYEKTGVIRDFVQNHILNLIALIAMEPPLGINENFLKDARNKIFKSIRKPEMDQISQMSFGQYDAGKIDGKNVTSYRKENNVDPNSKVLTFFASKFFIDNWMWASVPFYVRCGKRLKKRVTEISIVFKQPPLKLLGQTCSKLDSNIFSFSLYPKEKIALNFNVKYPGFYDLPYGVKMVFDYEEVLKHRSVSPYERLLIDIIKDDHTLFASQENIELMWDIVDPITQFYESKQIQPELYSAGSWGPKSSFDLIEKDGRNWQVFE